MLKEQNNSVPNTEIIGSVWPQPGDLCQLFGTVICVWVEKEPACTTGEFSSMQHIQTLQEDTKKNVCIEYSALQGCRCHSSSGSAQISAAQRHLSIALNKGLAAASGMHQPDLGMRFSTSAPKVSLQPTGCHLSHKQL